MHPVAFLFLVVASVALLVLPRRWAPIPLLAGACYMTLGQGFEIAGLNFPILRLLFLAGIVRVLLRGERPTGGLVGMDKLFLLWAAWAVAVSAFHDRPGATLENRLGMVYNALSVYFLLRCFLQSPEDVWRVVCIVAWLLLPVALEMLAEQFTQRNAFAVFGGVPDEPAVRQGRIRSQGPFAHAILAGTVGAVCLPMLVGIWHTHPWSARVGVVAGLLMGVTAASSGPLLAVIIGLFALILWRWRHLTRQMRIAAVVGYLLLDLVMKAPAYYLIARIDVVGGSAAYHRSALIQSAIKYFNEWWLVGTHYTRHWMPYGVPWSEDHADITNHYLGQGIKGGILLMGLFIGLLWCGFRYVGQVLVAWGDLPREMQFRVWTLGATLFSLAASAVSVAYFDQSIVFLYLTLALITTVHTSISPRRRTTLLENSIGNCHWASCTRTSP